MSQETTRYMEPAKELLEIIDAPATPSLGVNPTKTHALLASPQEMPDIADMAQPELRLAGTRINPKNFGDSKPFFWNSLSLQRIDSNESYPISGLPEDGNIRFFRWSPNGEKLAIVVYKKTTIELWVADTERGVAKKWASDLNSAIMGVPIEWAPDSKTIYFASRILSREGMSFKDALPVGPSVQVSSGKKTAVRTYQDMLQNPIDEDMFEYYATSTLAKVSENSNPKVIGNPGLYRNFSVSPNGEYLLVQQIMRPFSYIVPYYSFPIWVEIWNNEGILLKKLAEIPLAESIPQGFSAVREGPRSHQWRGDKPATVVWAEAQDEGNPKKVAEIRDLLYMLETPFKDKPKAFLSLNYRFSGITWGWDNLAVVYEQWWETRKIVTSFFNPSNPEESKRIIGDRSWQDAYSDPGNFITELNNWGYSVLKTNRDNSILYLSGQGASPQGNMPFLDELNLKTLKTKRLWQCKAPYFEQFITALDNPIQKILTQRESEAEQPNFFIRDLKRDKSKAFTSFPHPYPQLANVQKELVRYKRSDGIELTATLYLPANYKKGSKKLPVLMWAYPQEYVDANLAAQITESPYRFIRPSRLSPVMWVARGYAVFDRVGMPIVAKDSLLPNDTFVEQLTENAKAAIDYLVEQKIADPKRIAIGGHSYGAFMTANLLAHTNLFAAGIARSGAYNRTLTPFGFQGEERTYWEAPEVYDNMSPFMHADKLKKPLLLIHGVDDNNSGTFPLQSERLYQAINGHGGTTRLVMLPFESHGYRARQSLLHQAWEIDTWLEKYLK
ncbi:MAG: prolyl oligopeptidase family serine peptidase [Bacteroidales bacterium]|nr:prolyl oligopeptidase family serine peptidase [Bacteroidales bacterium]MDY0198632.1 prolyl oligopeptidase family serine peptidase [Tenuifilaceae bacterium]